MQGDSQMSSENMSTEKMSNENRHMELRDGRTLAWAEYGAPNGRVLFFFHGGNDSRLAGRLLAQDATRLEIRLVCPDRPGYGRSTFRANRTIAQWADDVEELADRLEATEYGVVGHSGGGPHALACAYGSPARVRSAVLVSSPAPPGAPNRGLHPAFRLVNLLFRSPRLYRPLANNQLKQMIKSQRRWLSVWGRMQPADGELFTRNPQLATTIVAEMLEGAQEGVDGIVHEASLYHADWGFDLGDVSPDCDVWHGSRDRQASPAWGEYLTRALPNSALHLDPNGGHFSTLINNAEMILSTAVGPDRDATSA